METKIKQYNTTYTITQQGNQSFRVSFLAADSKQIKYIPTLFSSAKEAEDYIATCKSMDMFC